MRRRGDRLRKRGIHTTTAHALVLIAVCWMLTTRVEAAQPPERIQDRVEVIPVVGEPGCDKPNAGLAPRVLRAQVNGELTRQTLLLYQRPCGALLAATAELQGLRVRTRDRPTVTIDGERYLNLNAYPGLSWRIDTARQVLVLEGEPQVFIPTVLDFAPETEVALSESIASAFLNYSVFTSGTFGAGEPAHTAFASLGASGWPGFLLTDATASYQPAATGGGTFDFLRIRTTFKRDYPGWIASLRAGDIGTNPGQWGSALNLAGLQFGTNFSTRPYLNLAPVTTLDAAITRSAALQLRQYQLTSDPERDQNEARGRVVGQVNAVPYGPVELVNLPVFRNGAYELKLRDRFGGETRVRQPYFFGRGLLRVGLNDYSVGLGVPRVDVLGDRYEGFAASGTWRRGLTRFLTGEVHAEGSEDAAAVGVSTRWAVPYLGQLTATHALSEADGTGTGQYAALSLENRYRRGGYALRATCTGEDFRRARGGTNSTGVACLSFASGSLQLPGAQSISAGVSNTNTRGGPDRQNLFANLFGRVPGLGSTYTVGGTYGITEGDGDNTWAVFGSISATLGGLRRAVTRRPAPLRRGVRRGRQNGLFSDDRTRFRVSANKIRGADWRASGRVTTSDTIRGRHLGLALTTDLIDFESQGLAANWTGRRWLGQAALSRSGDTERYSLGVSSGLAWLGGELHLTRPLFNSYALVRLGEDYRNVRVNGRATGRRGSVLIPQLQPYINNTLSIAADDLSFDTRAESLRLTAAPRFRRGVVLDARLRRVVDALVTIELLDASGARTPLPLGAAVQVKGGGAASGSVLPVGLNGEVYVEDVVPGTELVVFRGGGLRQRRCRIALPDLPRPAQSRSGDDPGNAGNAGNPADTGNAGYQGIAEIGPLLCDTAAR